MSTRIVLDASAALEAVLLRPRAEAVLDVIGAASLVSAPDLFAAEAANGLWKHVRSGDLEPHDAHDALRYAMDLTDQLVATGDLVPETLATAMAYGHPVYDALYAVAARRTGASVCTLDRRLQALLTEMRVETVPLG